MQTMRVAVVGCGTAGPAAALNLSRRLGWTVDMFDKAAVPAAVGAGIGAHPLLFTALFAASRAAARVLPGRQRPSTASSLAEPNANPMPTSPGAC